MNPQSREAGPLKALALRSLVITWALVVAIPVAAMSQTDADASVVCPEGSGSACSSSVPSSPSSAVGLGGRPGLAVTDPIALIGLGAGLLSLGFWTRRILPARRETSSG